MNVLGAVKFLKSAETVFFCEYRCTDFEWNSLCSMLDRCFEQGRMGDGNLKEDDIRCVAVGAIDGEPNAEAILGISCFTNGEMIVFTPKENSYLDEYFNEL